MKIHPNNNLPEIGRKLLWKNGVIYTIKGITTSGYILMTFSIDETQYSIDQAHMSIDYLKTQLSDKSCEFIS